MSELMRQLIGVKPYPIPACAIRPMLFDEGEESDKPEIYCSTCRNPELTANDFYTRADGRKYRQCKKCMNEYAAITRPARRASRKAK